MTAMFAVTGCVKNDAEMSGPKADAEVKTVPHIYGWATLDDSAPQTRGIALRKKKWGGSDARDFITVKFLNGVEPYKKFVKEVAHEWELYGNVKFHFLEDDAPEAVVRIAFDNKDMKTTWSLTGTDHIDVIDYQNEPTMHFAQWSGMTSNAKRRSDVLRAFGQVLGLELEFRHPNFTPGWVTDGDGNIDEERIRQYWEDQLADAISWEELRDMVLKPVSSSQLVAQTTAEYDPESVMVWPFYELIAENVPVIYWDEDYNTELSEQDKAFIEILYGPADGGTPPPVTEPTPKHYRPLIEFDYTSAAPEFTLSTTSDLAVIWEKGDTLRIEVPEDLTEALTQEVTHTYAGSGTHSVVIAEPIYTDEIPASSTALTGFDFTGGEYAKNLDVEPCNDALAYFRLVGGYEFEPQMLVFSNFNALKELYLTWIQGSSVAVLDCGELTAFGTTPYIWNPFDQEDGYIVQTSGAGSSYGRQLEEMFGQINPLVEIPPVGPPIMPDTLHLPIDPIFPPIVVLPPDMIVHDWPKDPVQVYSLDDSSGPKLNIRGCENLEMLSLDNARIRSLDFSGMPKLRYVYLSTPTDCLVGGGEPAGAYLLDAIETLREFPFSGSIPSVGKSNDADIDLDSRVLFFYRGLLVLRGIGDSHYTDISLTNGQWNAIHQELVDKGWQAAWDSGVEIQ